MASTPFPFPADRIQLPKTREEDTTWLVYRKVTEEELSSGSGKKKKEKNSNATFLSYSNVDLTPLPVRVKSKKRRADPPVLPPKLSGTSGPVPRGTRDDSSQMDTDHSWSLLSDPEYMQVEEQSSTEMPSQLELLAMADDEEPETSATFEPRVQPGSSSAQPGTSGPVTEWTMTSPYPGILVDDRTKRLLSRMDKDEVTQLLKPLEDAEPDLEGSRRVVEAYWLDRINYRHEVRMQSIGRVKGAHDRAGISVGGE